MGGWWVCACTYAFVHVRRRSEDLQKLVFFFYHVGSGDQTQVIMLGSKCLYPLILLSGLTYFDDDAN